MNVVPPGREVEFTVELIPRYYHVKICEEATWETEKRMRTQYPDRFTKSGMNFEDEILFKEERM